MYTLVALLASNRWAGQILQTQATESDAESQKHILLVPFRVGSRVSGPLLLGLTFPRAQIGKWIFFACIIVSFLLALWDARKARAIVKSRDI